MNTASIILQQLGGNRLKLMTGAKNFGIINELNGGLSFRIPKAKDGINLVEIRLNYCDLYDIEFKSITKEKVTIKKTVNGVFCSDLQRVFTEATGLYTNI